MAIYDVGPAADLPPGERMLVRVARQTVGVFNVHGRLYAVKNVCIHDQAPVCLGDVGGAYLPSAPGEYVWGLDGQVLRCPWHGWEFDLATGGALFDSETRLTTYPVAVANGRILVDIGGRRRS